MALKISRKKRRALIVVAAVVAVLAVLFIIDATWQGLPSGVELGNLDVTLIEKETYMSFHLGTGEAYMVPKKMYIFRPDGGLGIASYDEELSRISSINEPGCAYFVKGDTVYMCNILNEAQKVGTMSEFRVFKKVKLVDLIPDLGKDYEVMENSGRIVFSEEKRTWESVMQQVSQQLEQRGN